MKKREYQEAPTIGQRITFTIYILAVLWALFGPR